ncbi:SDR family NAD(P)-dependent oxidoreductase [Geodermatophilus maliterrae]|uniref:SDR family NAD(P)-dependent oxidoreductase n=1 Tax=Geodermatophilus maliterrae TaxID=3162531 RepID=A0ABV3XBK3_9ACTN
MAPPLAVVTGASSGIGEAFSRQLSHQGFRVLAVARRIDRLESLEVQTEGRVIGLPQDLRQPDAAEVVARRAEELGGAELLVSNAGRGIFGPFDELDAQDARDIIQLNVTFPVELIQRLLPTMLARRRGGLIVVTSAGAHYSTPNLAVYGGTKAFLLSFTEALATELRGTGVRALALCPGPTASEFGQVAGMGELLDGAPGLMTPDQVAAAGLRAWRRGRVVHVPGGLNRVMTATMARLPRPVTRRIVSAVFQP